jgi:hypothetical protein
MQEGCPCVRCRKVGRGNRLVKDIFIDSEEGFWIWNKNYIIAIIIL